MSFLAVLGLRLRVDYFDSYQNLLNARAILRRDPSEYTIYRGIFYPVLLLPATAAGLVLRSPGLTFALAHLSALALFGLLLLGTFLLLRTQSDRDGALLGTALLSINLLIINSGPLVKEDIPGAAFITSALYLYWRGRKSGRTMHFLAAGLLAGLGAGVRYQLLPTWLVFIALFEIGASWHRGGRGQRWKAVRDLRLIGRLLAAGLTPVIVLFLFPLALYPLLGRASLLHAPVRFLEDLRIVGDAVRVNEGSWQNYRFIVNSVTWPLLLAGAAGIVVSLRRLPVAAIFHGLWIVLFFGLQTYLIGHKEARFLYPCFPSIYFFVSNGLRWIPALAARAPRPAPRRLLIAALVALLLAWPVALAIGALYRFTDPVYTTDYEAAVSRYAAGLAAGGRVLWLGPAYPLHPRSYLFDRADAYTYIYHYYSHVVTYWTGVEAIPSASVTFVWRDTIVYPDQGMLALLGDGDALIINLEPSAYAAPNAPLKLKPLIVERATITSLAADAATPGTYRSAGASIVAIRDASEVVLRGAGLKDGDYELLLSSAAGPRLPTADAITQVSNGRFELRVPGDVWASRAPEQGISLVAFANARAFTSPGQ